MYHGRRLDFVIVFSSAIMDTAETPTDADNVVYTHNYIHIGLFSSSLVAVVGLSSPRKLRICHFKKGSEICHYSYSTASVSLPRRFVAHTQHTRHEGAAHDTRDAAEQSRSLRPVDEQRRLLHRVSGLEYRRRGSNFRRHKSRKCTYARTVVSPAPPLRSSRTLCCCRLPE